jgi:Fur family peroxide stress response transcriptional regulator
VNRKVNWTTQRRVIYELIQTAKDHPTANDVLERLRESGHQFAYGTVYNSLRYLVEMGLVRELKLGNAVSRFDGRIEDHLHIICDVCGTVAEAAVELPDTWLSEVASKTNFTVENAEIVLHGVCQNCRNQRTSE